MPEDKDPTIYGTLTKFKQQYDRNYLLRLGSVGDLNPSDFTFDITGTHDGVAASTNLIDSTQSFKTELNLEIGMTVTNVTDGSSGLITAIVSETEITVALSGGSDNKWDPADSYKILEDRIDKKLTAALEDAADEMDGFLVSQVATPVVKFPDYFEKDCYKIAVRILIQRKGYSTDSPDHQAVRDGKDCLNKYEKIATGKLKLSLPDDAGEAAVALRTAACTPTKQFSRSVLDAFNFNNQRRPKGFDDSTTD